MIFLDFASKRSFGELAITVFFIVFSLIILWPSLSLQLAVTHTVTHKGNWLYGNSGTKKLKRNFILSIKRPRAPETAPWTLWIRFVINRSCVQVTSAAPKRLSETPFLGTFLLFVVPYFSLMCPSGLDEGRYN